MIFSTYWYLSPNQLASHKLHIGL